MPESEVRSALLMSVLAAFVQSHAPRSPGKPADNPDQLRLLTTLDGVVNLALGNATQLQCTPSAPGYPAGRALWVLDGSGMPAIIEIAPGVRSALTSGVAKHTNLTGGQQTCCGGECWVDTANDSKLFVNGGSGRYEPRSPVELDAAVEVVRSFGYQVVSAGWDEDTEKPARIFRER